MKNKLKKVAFTGMAALALFGAGTGVAFASGYITWNGTENYNEILQGLDDMERRHNELGGERSQMIRELIQRADKIEEHETTIAELNEQIEELQKEGPATEAGKLKQAEQDMEHVNERTQEVLKNMSDAFSK